MKRARRSPRAPTLAVPKVRNPVARSPLMNKGGAHGKTTAAARRLAKMDLARLDPRGRDET